MNQGQFDAIKLRLDRIIELLEAEQAISVEIAELQADYAKANPAPPAEPESKPAPAKAPAKRSKAA